MTQQFNQYQTFAGALKTSENQTTLNANQFQSINYLNLFNRKKADEKTKNQIEISLK